MKKSDFYDFKNRHGRYPFERRASLMVEKPKDTPAENQWPCSNCGYILEAKAPPEVCPSCSHRCEFLNVTCYTPDCDFTGVDPRVTKK